MKSMTGYAKVQCTLGSRKLNIEIKTLNSKQLDLNVKLPTLLRSRELEVRNILGCLERGKVDCTVTEELNVSEPSLNEELLRSRYSALKSIADNLGESSDCLLPALVSMNDIWNSATAQEITDDEWNLFQQAFQQAINTCDAFRTHEGSVLEIDFHRHVDSIETMLNQIPNYETDRIDTAKDRIRRWMADAEIKDVDENRFEQELIYYLEKYDITEEKVRLQKHIDYFRQTMENEASCGKKLGFVAQEMGREINTTGSKANNVDIQRLVVGMKDELEKIKEQLGNVL